jgi:hypothetical protein
MPRCAKPDAGRQIATRGGLRNQFIPIAMDNIMKLKAFMAVLDH